MSAQLLSTRRFWPLFWTQLLGAFNDNLFKNALVIMIAFREVTVGGLNSQAMVALAAGILILPFFLFSATAGQLADKFDKALLVRWTKSAEIGVMMLGALGLIFEHVPMLLGVLFLMGLQSAFFGPCKYSILPEHLSDEELVGGNALVELGTFLGILLGTLAGGLLVALTYGTAFVAAAVLGVAVIGRVTARFIPAAPAGDPGLKINWSPIGPTWQLVKLCRANDTIFQSILGISWFWAFGSVFLSLFPVYTKDVIGGDETIATLFLALFSIGIGAGSIICEKLSHDRVELGLVPLGSIGLSVFTADLWWVGTPFGTVNQVLSIGELLSTFVGWRIVVDLLLLSVSGGFLIVPLYALVQQRAPSESRSRTIAGSNILNALFMVAGSVVLAVFLGQGLDAPTIFGVLAAMNAAVAIYIYLVVPEFMLRFITWVLSNFLYRVRVEGHEHIPREGACVLVCNHVSYIDWFILSGAVRRPTRFVMHKDFYRMRVINGLLRQAKAIPIAGHQEDPEVLQSAMDSISAELQNGEVVCIFPEGRLTDDGNMMPFRSGIERIIARDPVPVVPLALNGLWGSFFSRRDGKAMTKPFRRFWSQVSVTIEAPVAPESVTAQGLEQTVRSIWQRRPDVM